ncbi:ATP synthase F1 subunit gamma [Candidatus Nomurabacteria bacterium]|nr:ATP synthase F1 subunit gamma [Candidatus Nomurabacteria bacterium]
MASTKEIKSRIKSVKNTKKITKAMELVAASKMKRAVSSTLASRLYAEYSWEILTSLANSSEKIEHPLFVQREVKNILLVLITSNRGLCGAYNAQVIKKSLALLSPKSDFGLALSPTSGNIDIVTIGRKGDTAMRRISRNVIASFTELPDTIKLADIVPVSSMIMDEYTSGNYDKVLVAYTDFVSALTQKANIKQILPISKEQIKELIETVGDNSQIESKPLSIDRGLDSISYTFEGDQDALLKSLAEKLSRMQIYQMLLESNASEQSSRMVAMKNASDAAGEMIDDLTLVFNKARQASITQEISEISAGMASVS